MLFQVELLQFYSSNFTIFSYFTDGSVIGIGDKSPVNVKVCNDVQIPSTSASVKASSIQSDNSASKKRFSSADTNEKVSFKVFFVTC